MWFSVSRGVLLPFLTFFAGFSTKTEKEKGLLGKLRNLQLISYKKLILTVKINFQTRTERCIALIYCEAAKCGFSGSHKASSNYR